MARELIVNADDFGLGLGVSAGIIEAHRRGIVTSCNLLVNAVTLAELEMLRNDPELGIGIHINLTRGMPIFKGNLGNLMDENGRFRIEHRDGFDGVDEEHIRAEVRAQVEMALATDLENIDHIDSHHHVQRDRKVFDAIKDIAVETGLACRASDEWMIPELRDAGIWCNDHFVGDFFGDGNIEVANLAAIIDGLEDGVTELMCHPGHAAMRINIESGYLKPRLVELATLTDPSIKELIREKKIRLRRFSGYRHSAQD
jgi:predicted glycoside hydrolase/deacetylase ChbG (UPF0249 family)